MSFSIIKFFCYNLTVLLSCLFRFTNKAHTHVYFIIFVRHCSRAVSSLVGWIAICCIFGDSSSICCILISRRHISLEQVRYNNHKEDVHQHTSCTHCTSVTLLLGICLTSLCTCIGSCLIGLILTLWSRVFGGIILIVVIISKRWSSAASRSFLLFLLLFFFVFRSFLSWSSATAEHMLN